jgi:hypothetical protein
MSHILDFKNWRRVYEAEGDGTSTITPLGDTGISVVTFGENTSFMAPDTKPYILLLAGSVKFQGFAEKPSAKEVAVSLETDEMDKKGAFKSVTTTAGTSVHTPTQIFSGVSPTIPQATALMSEIVKALYVYNESVGVSKERVMQTIKAMKIIKNDYAAEVANNSLFNNLYKQMIAVSNAGNLTTLAKSFAGQRPGGNEQNILDGAIAAMASK